ncbi:MAG: hypothetical protein V4541_09515 [Bacteroidota bacterium]
MLTENFRSASKRESTDALHGGGTLRSTVETSVMEVEGSIIQVLENIEGNCLTAGGTEMKKTKPFTIGKIAVMNAYLKVKVNKGSGGVDKKGLQDFELDKANHLHKLWNQMNSGSYMPCAVNLVEIP